MTQFEEKLKNGIFVISFCQSCKKPIWPPSNNCDICHNVSTWETASKIGKVIEFSKKDANYFALIETNNQIRILGSIVGNVEPKIGQNVELEKCSFNDSPKFVFKLTSQN